MILKDQPVGEVTVVEVDGRVDSANAPKLEDHVAALIRGGKKSVLLDLAKVEYISSAGFRTLLLLARQAGEAQSRFALCSLTPKVHRLFDMGGFLDLLPIAQTREEGLSAK
ncbi:MAG: STAS domain-containing protein [Bacillota bacterium]